MYCCLPRVLGVQVSGSKTTAFVGSYRMKQEGGHYVLRRNLGLVLF